MTRLRAAVRVDRRRAVGRRAVAVVALGAVVLAAVVAWRAGRT